MGRTARRKFWAKPAQPARGRDPFYLPFSSLSPWNLPVVVGTTTYDMPSLRSTTPWVNFENYSHNVYQASEADPLVKCVDIDHTWLDPIYWRIPTTAQPAVGTDGHLTIVSPDRKQHLQLFAASWQGDHYQCYRMYATSLIDDGLGPAQGVRAYGGSAIGGLIREWEIDKNNPKYTGKIEHALAMAIDGQSQLGKNTAAWTDGWGYYWDDSATNAAQQPGWVPGRNRNDFMKQTGYLWPATEQDYGSMSADWYHGDIPMGAYFVIPSSVNIDQLGLTPEGRMLAEAAQDYGAYIVDASGGSTVFYVEYKSDSFANCQPFVDTVRANYALSDVAKIIAALRRVAVNDEQNPNGGPLNAPRRRPLAPEIAL